MFLDFYRNPKPEITNAAIGLPEKHPLLAKALENIESYFDPHCWICIGPQLLTDLAIEMGNVSNIEEIEASSLLPVVPDYRLHPHDHDEGPPLYFSEDPISFKEWKSMFENSSAIHFYNKFTQSIVVEDDPSHFLYALLGPRYCPVSYYSTKQF